MEKKQALEDAQHAWAILVIVGLINACMHARVDYLLFVLFVRPRLTPHSQKWVGLPNFSFDLYVYVCACMYMYVYVPSVIFKQGPQCHITSGISLQ